MSHPQYRSHDVWALDLPAENDKAFVLTVLEKIERRRFRKKMLLIAATMFISLCALIVAVQSFETLLQDGFKLTGDPGVWALVVAVLAIASTEMPGSLISEDL